jgi:hypothetical protein
MDFYDIHEQTKYKITISQPENVEELSDMFTTKEELESLVGTGIWINGNSKRSFFLDKVISEEIAKLGKKLDESGKKTILIEDHELLDALKGSYVSDYDAEGRFGRHGDRLCYARRYTRKKTKPTQGDVRAMWSQLQYAFRRKFGCYPSHIPRYDRHLTMFKAWQKIIGWKAFIAGVGNKEDRKWFRMIWKNPEEYMK